MLWLCELDMLTCDHLGRIITQAAQRWVTVSGAAVLVETDLVGRPIAACPNMGPNIKPCTSTLMPVAGPSLFVRVNGVRAMTSAVDGLTDGTPPGVAHYRVLQPAQNLVRVDR